MLRPVCHEKLIQAMFVSGHEKEKVINNAYTLGVTKIIEKYFQGFSKVN